MVARPSPRMHPFTKGNDMIAITLTLTENTVENLEAVAGHNGKPLTDYLQEHLTRHAAEALHQAARRRAFRRCSSCGQLHPGSGADETTPALACVACGRHMTAAADRFEPTGSAAAGAPARDEYLVRLFSLIFAGVEEAPGAPALATAEFFEGVAAGAPARIAANIEALATHGGATYSYLRGLDKAKVEAFFRPEKVTA